MAHNFQLAEASANAAADAVCRRANGGAVRLYDGTQPGSPDMPVQGQRLLAECRLSDPAFTPAVGGVAQSGPIQDEAENPGTGTATWFRVVSKTGQAVFDGTVGRRGERVDLALNTVAISAGGILTLDRLTYTQPKT